MKEFIVSEICHTLDHEIRVIGRTAGDDEIRLGDSLGGMRVMRLEAYGRSLDFFSPGLTGIITLKPEKGGGYFILRETPKLEWK